MSSSISLRISSFMFSRLVTSRFTSCLNGIFRSFGSSFSIPLLYRMTASVNLPCVGELVSLARAGLGRL